MDPAQLTGLGAGQADKFRQRVRRHGRIDQEHRGHRRQRGNRSEIAQRVIGEIGVERRIDRQGAGISHHQHVAVRGRRRHHLGGNHAAGAGHILDHERFAERIAEPLRQQARQHIRIAARRRRGYQPNWP
jgi:hypothetical protein